MTTNHVIEHKRNFKQIFSRFVGPTGQPYTGTSLSVVTGLSKHTIQSHIDGRSLPSLPHLIIYFKVFELDFADAILSYAGLTVSSAEEHEAPTTHEAQLALAELMTEIVKALQDGHLDAVEKARLSPLLRKTGQMQIALANDFDVELKEVAA